MRSTKGKLNFIGFGTLTALCACMPLVLGGTPDGTVWFSAVVLGGLGLWQSFSSPIKVSNWLWVPIGLTIYYWVQLLPLPIFLLEFISPKSAQWARDTGLTQAPISLNPYETQLSALIQFCFVTTLVLGRLISSRQLRYLAAAIALSATVVSIIGWLHLIFDWDLVMGFYQPYDYTNPRGFVTSFINLNTGAAFLCLGVAASFGVTLQQANPRLARLGLFCAYICTAGVIMTESKAGLLLLCFMCSAWFYVLFLNRKFYRIRAYLPYRRTLLWFLCPAIIIGMIILVLMPEPERLDGWIQAIENKLDILHATPYLQDFWAVGSGRGSFETVYPIYQVSQVRGTFSHPENIVFQLLSETGILITSIVVCWAALLIKHIFQKVTFGTHPLQWSLSLALLVITLHQLADFGLESLGLMLPFAVLLGRLLYSRHEPAHTLPTSLFRLWALTPLVLICMHQGIPANPVGDAAMTSFQNCIKLEDTLEKTRQMIQSTPSDYLIYESALNNLTRCHPDDWSNSIAFAKQAQRRAPQRGSPRLLTGQLLAHHGYLPQAAIELRAAVTLSPWLWNEARIPMQVYLSKTPNLLFDAVGESPERRAGMFGFLLGKQQHDVAFKFLDQWLIHGLDLGEYTRRKAIICVRSKNLGCLKSLSRKHDARGQMLNAWLAYFETRRTDAVRVLEKTAQENIAERLSYSDAMLARELSVSLKNRELARRFASHQWAQSETVEQRTQALYAMSVIEEQFGNLQAAIATLEKVYKLAPNPRFLVRALKLEIKLSNESGARLKLNMLRARHPHHPKLESLSADVDALD